MYDYRNGDFDCLRGALEALKLCNLIQDSYDFNLYWTYWKDAFMSAVSDFIQGKKRPAFLCGKRRLLAQSWRNLLQTINNRSIANCVQRLRLVYVRAVRFTSAHLTQISRGSLNALGPFLKLKNKTLIFPETNSSGDDNQQVPQASTRKPANSSALCAELLGTSKAPKRVVHFIFLSSGAISAMQPKYGRHSPLAY